jgi:uncharacterized protein YjbI with pentapeptide repeats
MGNRNLFVRVDADSVGDQIELALLEGDTAGAQIIHNHVQESMKELRIFAEQNFGEILMQGCDDIFFNMLDCVENFERLEIARTEFFNRSGFTLSIGVGASLTEAVLSLTKAKLSGKNRTVISSKI